MWNDKHYWTEVYRLSLERFFRSMTQDRFITQFSNGFKGSPHDERGLLDAGPPAWWVEQYFKLEKKEHKANGAVNIGGNSFQFDAETGNLTIQSHVGATQILKGDLIKVLSFIMQGPPPELVQAQSTPGGTNAFEFSPQLKERHERNLQAMEEWARASSKTYPKSQ